DVDGAVDPHREAGPQGLAHSLRPRADDRHLASPRLPDPDPLLDRELVIGADDEGDARLVDPATVRAEPDARLRIGNLFDTNNDVHRILSSTVSGRQRDPRHFAAQVFDAALLPVSFRLLDRSGTELGE